LRGENQTSPNSNTSVICLPAVALDAKAGHLSSVFCHLSSVF
jgi:hypothetical protein